MFGVEKKIGSTRQLFAYLLFINTLTVNYNEYLIIGMAILSPSQLKFKLVGDLV